MKKNILLMAVLIALVSLCLVFVSCDNDSSVEVSETKTMAEILKTATGIPEVDDTTPPSNAWVNSTNPACKAFVGKHDGDKCFILKAGARNFGVLMDDTFEKVDDNTFRRVEIGVGTLTVKMDEGKFSSLEFQAESGSKFEVFNGTYSAPAAPTEYTVTFDLNGITGTAPTAQKIKDGEKVTKPADPTDTVHTFAGWYKTKDATTGALSDEWDFNTVVTENMTLYAKWVPQGFVDLGVTNAAGKPLYWAKCNLGATNPQDYGDYFAWGETAPYYEGTGGWPATLTWKSGKESGYAWQSYCGQSSFVEWSTPPYDATTKILKPEFDAATAANSSWRTPTSDEFKALAKQCFLEWTDSYNGTNVKGVIVWKAKGDDAGWFKTSTAGKGRKIKDDGSSYNATVDHTFSNTYTIGTDPCVFFPAAGYGNGTGLIYEGSYGAYWSSSLNTGSTSKAYSLGFNSDCVYPPGNNSRYCGSSVRPVTEVK